MDSNEIEKGKTIAIISYILVFGPLIALSMNREHKNKFASFHIRQGVGLTILFISLGLIISNFENINIAMPMWIGISVLMIYGIISASKGDVKPMPLFGSFFQKWFGNL